MKKNCTYFAFFFIFFTILLHPFPLPLRKGSARVAEREYYN